MSTREMAYDLIDRLSDEQVEGFIQMFRGFINIEEQPNSETIEAMKEADRIARDPSVKAYTDIDKMFEEILSN